MSYFSNSPIRLRNTLAGEWPWGGTVEGSNALPNLASNSGSNDFTTASGGGTSSSVAKLSGLRTLAGRTYTESPTFKVVAVGPRGAGKSVLLSSMFHSMNFRDDHRSYFLEASPEMRVVLSKIYGTLVDAYQPWPESTQGTREYSFKCVAFDEENVKHPVLTINYLDYAGELLVEEQKAESNALQNLFGHIKSANALLCMVDGYRVLQLLRDEAEGHKYFQVSMQAMIGIIQDTSCPVHLVISKWDIVRDFGEPPDADEQDRLEYVIEALMKFDHIRALVQQRRAHQIVRIIPVSSVGRNFARINSAGVMVKRHGAQMKPINIDVPLCAVVPDWFSQIEASLNERARQMLNAELRMRAGLGPGKVMSGVAAFLKRPAAAVVRAILFWALGQDVGGETASMFFAWMAQPYEKAMSENAENRRTAELELERFESTRARVLNDFTNSTLKLEALFPNSRLDWN